MTNLPQAVAAPDPVAHHLLRVHRIHEQSVAIEKVGMRLLEPLHDVADRMAREQEVVRVYQSHDVARSRPKSFVYSLIHAVVRLRYYLRYPVLILVDHVHRPVRRSPVHHNIFDVGIILCQHTLNTSANCLHAVVA